ncbi:hypothetical protein Q8F55_003292 [Vanrija albida]|uniref:NACHT-NTPase and P-loop NTPases N-terminal domain-containing protein n=1 Tax=Vanrija albida TaxID=181172 RepID=A0ABR3Q3U6_9TREE
MDAAAAMNSALQQALILSNDRGNLAVAQAASLNQSPSHGRDAEANVADGAVIQRGELELAVQLLRIGGTPNPPRTDPFTPAGYMERCAFVAKIVNKPCSTLPAIRIFLEGVVAALRIQYEAMTACLEKLTELRPRLDAAHPRFYLQAKIIMETDMEDNSDIRGRMARLILRIENRDVNGIVTGVAHNLANDLFHQAMGSFAKGVWCTTNDEATLLETARGMHDLKL